MRFGTRGGRFVFVHNGLVLDLHTASAGALPGDPLRALERWDDVFAFAGATDWTAAEPLDEASLGPPVPHPRQVFAVALNYRPHAAEAGFVAPDSPLVFTKFPSCIVGPSARVRLPDGKVDWEIEVVAVIGRGGHRIDRRDAWDAVAGLTGGQDLSERALQLAGAPAQFSLGKSYPRFGPTGPVAVTPDELPDRDDVAFESFLYADPAPAGESAVDEQPHLAGQSTVDAQSARDREPAAHGEPARDREPAAHGEPLQRGRTSEMIFPIDDLVTRLSAVCPLLPGDLIFTGTPAGVGNRRQPPRYLRPGETLVSRFEAIGELRQHFTP